MVTRYRLQRLKVCKTCKHHVSVHKWDPERDARTGPFDCQVPGCTCTKFNRKEDK
jgi:hypothetical protein